MNLLRRGATPHRLVGCVRLVANPTSSGYTSRMRSQEVVKLCRMCGNANPHRQFSQNNRIKTYSACRLCETAAQTRRQTRDPFKRERKSWSMMLSRCRNPNSVQYNYYGGRGIKVCKRWLKFENFLTDMGRRPTPQHSLDRINNDGSYSPKNCRWATRQEQSHNRSDNHYLTLRGETLTMIEWARRYGMSIKTLHSRVVNGWSDERAITEPVKKRKRR